MLNKLVRHNLDYEKAIVYAKDQLGVGYPL